MANVIQDRRKKRLSGGLEGADKQVHQDRQPDGEGNRPQQAAGRAAVDAHTTAAELLRTKRISVHEVKLMQTAQGNASGQTTRVLLSSARRS
jgi:hypothetical protein